MAMTTKMIAVGDGLGVILPNEMLARLKVAIGDSVFLSESPSGLH
jgi:antitoxin component of MazEF toxin-antitoxin module